MFSVGEDSIDSVATVHFDFRIGIKFDFNGTFHFQGVEKSSRPITVKFGCKLSTQIVADAFADYFSDAVRYVSRHSNLVVVYTRHYVTVTNVHDDACEALKGGPFQ